MGDINAFENTGNALGLGKDKQIAGIMGILKSDALVNLNTQRVMKKMPEPSMTYNH